MPWAGSTSAAVVHESGAWPIRRLPGRDDATDVAAIIAVPLDSDELSTLSGLPPIDAPVWLPPVQRPSKNVLCVGKNYLEHVNEGARAEGLVAAEVPEVPIWFTKPATALVGDGADIVRDEAFTTALDYEGELAVVIGAPTRGVSPGEASDRIFGYTILNDVTARDVQQRHKQWFRGKSADSYAPCGPWVVTRDEIADPQDLLLTTRVNGEVRQRASTRDMIFDIAVLVSDISQGITLLPGDIIATGTPSGVAWGMTEPKYLLVGDSVSVEISGIGTLTNRVVGAR